MTVADRVVVQLEADVAKAKANITSYSRTFDSEMSKVERSATRVERAANRSLAKVGSGLNRNQLLTIQYTINDIVASLSSGASPLTILAQQGGQVTQAFGGLRGTFALLGRSVLSVGGLIGAAAVSVGALGKAWYDAEANEKRFERALFGGARAVGLTAKEMEELAVRAADAGEISVGAARDLELAFARTGLVSAPVLEKAITLTKDLAAALSVDVEKAGQILAKALADPKSGIDDLNGALGFLDDKTARYLQKLVKQGDLSKAQAILVDQLATSIKGAADETTGWSKTFDALARAAQNAWSWIGKAIDRATQVGGADVAVERRNLTAARSILEDRIRKNPFDAEAKDSLRTVAAQEQALAARERAAAEREKQGEQAAKNIRDNYNRLNEKPSGGPSAADVALRQSDRFNSLLGREQQAELRARAQLARTAEERYALGLRALELEERAADEDLDLAVQKKELTRAQADQIKAQQRATRASERTALLRERNEALDDKALRTADMEAGARDRIAGARAGSLTPAERLADQRGTLISSQKRERTNLQTDLEQRGYSLEEIDAQLTLLNEAHAAELQALYHDALYDGVRGGLEAALDGNGLQFLRAKLREAVLDSMAQGITAGLARAAAGKEGGGWISKAFSVGAKIFGFGRAAGGNVVGGVPYQLNEKGMLEGFVPAQSGKVIPLGNTKAASRGGGGVVVLQTIKLDAKGSVMTADLLEQVNVISSSRASEAVAVATRIAERNGPGRFQRFSELGT